MNTNLSDRRPLRGLQIEVTSRCSRRCAVCPQKALPERWREGDLEEEVWKILEPDLALAEHVNLQGWGEPLLHPGLPGFIEAAHRAGCTIGLTTNGDKLGEVTDWLLDSELDLITISIAGDPAMHAEMRGDSNLLEVLAAASRLAARSREHRNKLLVQANYLLTSKNSAELPAVVELAARANLHELSVSHLDCRVSVELEELSAFGPELKDGVLVSLQQAEKVARHSGIKYRGPAQAQRQMLTCALDPTRFSLVGFDGRVGPCVNLMMPIQGPIPLVSDGQESAVEQVVFGNLREKPLAVMLESEARNGFIGPFLQRVEAERRFFNSLDLEPGSAALQRLDEADLARMATLEANPFPGTCSGCPRRLGW